MKLLSKSDVASYSAQESQENPTDLLLAPVRSSLEGPDLEQLVVAVLTANFEQLQGTEELRKLRKFRNTDGLNIRIRGITNINTDGIWPDYLVGITVFEEGADFGAAVDLNIRTNGYVALIGRSWKLEQEFMALNENRRPEFLAVFKSSDGMSFNSIPQTELLLSALPDSIALSRAMSEEEFSLWRNGGIDKLQTMAPGPDGPATGSPRTFFALNNYAFFERNQVKIEVSRDFLKDLYDRGLFSINTYSSAGEYGSSSASLPDEALTGYGLETELVVHGLEGQRKIMPFIQEAINLQE